MLQLRRNDASTSLELCLLMGYLLGGILQLGLRVPVETERLVGFSAHIVEGHVGDVLVPGTRGWTQQQQQQESHFQTLCVRLHFRLSLLNYNVCVCKTR